MSDDLSKTSPAFQEAAAAIKGLTYRPTDDELLRLYGLFKQATVGDNTTQRPGMFDLKGKAKWDSWTGNKGKSSEVAQNEYIALVNELKAK